MDDEVTDTAPPTPWERSNWLVIRQIKHYSHTMMIINVVFSYGTVKNPGTRSTAVKNIDRDVVPCVMYMATATTQKCKYVLQYIFVEYSF